MRRIFAAIPLGSLLLGAVCGAGGLGPASAGGPGTPVPEDREGVEAIHVPEASALVPHDLLGEAAGPAPVRIAGTVRSDAGTPGDATDDVGLGGVTVTATAVRGGTAVLVETDPAGAYVLAGLPPGAFDLAFSRPGFSEGGVEAVMASATSAPLDALLSPLP